MLTDTTEGEFDLKEEEPWYDHQDLEHDLHLAAELGKNLLEQNRDLEQTLQQMHETNQEQLQEIEHLSKQVDLLRSVNDQHAKVYEQLDSTSRDLELKNQRLVLENRAAKVKIDGLTETVDGLQTQVEELQRDMKKLKQSRSVLDAPQHDDVQGLTCCKQKCQFNKCFSHERSIPSGCCSVRREEPDEELLRSTRSLRAQLRTERAQREAAEREADALAQELGELEPKAALLGVYERRLAEMEAEVEELRLLLRSSKNNPSLLDEEVGVASHRGWSGERHHGISLLNEMDAQFVALKEQHDALLRRCEERVSNPASRSQPAYKALFHQLFTFIQKSKEDLKENRTKPVQVE